MKPIVAFLQNPWFKLGTKPHHIKLFQEDQDFRRRVISMSRTGQCLLSAFGDELYDHIWWDEANPEPCFNSSQVRPPDVKHISDVLIQQQPFLVVTFGAMAHQGLHDALQWLKFKPSHRLHSAHPTARGAHRPDLIELADKIRELAA